MTSPAINSSAQVIEKATSHMKAKDMALYAAGGALVCTTCYLLFRNWQLSSQNADVEHALRTSFEAQVMSIEVIDEVVKQPPIQNQTSASNTTPSNITLWGAFTGSGSSVGKSSHQSTQNVKIKIAYEKNLEAQVAISKVMPEYRPQLNQIYRNQQPTLAEEALRGVVRGAASVVGQEVAKGVQSAVDPTNYLRTVATWGVSSALGYLGWSNK